MRVLDRHGLVAGRHVTVAEVDPLGVRRIRHPRMLLADVVDDHVHDQADAPATGRAHQLAQAQLAAQTRVHPVEVGGRVTGVGARWHASLQHRVQPHRGETHAVDVVQARGDARDVAAVAAVGTGAVRRVAHAGDRVVARVAVGEAVRRDQVDRVGRAEALGVRRIGVLALESVVQSQRAPLARQVDVKASRARRRVHAQIDEQVVGAVAAARAAHRDSPGSSPSAAARRRPGR